MTTALSMAPCPAQDRFYFQSYAEFGTVLKDLMRHHSLEEVNGGQWGRHWCRNGEEVATVYEGRHYGVNLYIRRSLIAGRQFDFRRSRNLTHSEVHILNRRLRDNRDLDVGLLPEVEHAYRLLKEQGRREVSRMSAEIFWLESAFPLEAKPFSEYVE